MTVFPHIPHVDISEKYFITCRYRNIFSNCRVPCDNTYTHEKLAAVPAVFRQPGLQLLAWLTERQDLQLAQSEQTDDHFFAFRIGRTDFFFH
jgi:hypothetical protein